MKQFFFFFLLRLQQATDARSDVTMALTDVVDESFCTESFSLCVFRGRHSLFWNPLFIQTFFIQSNTLSLYRSIHLSIYCRRTSSQTELPRRAREATKSGPVTEYFDDDDDG